MIAKANITGWKWRFLNSRIFHLPFTHKGEPLTIESNSGNTLVTLDGSELLIERHYHFDGATYALDFENVLLAAAVHDSILQLCEKYPNELTTDQAHEAFKWQMDLDGFKLSRLYYSGVKIWFKLKLLL